MDKRSLSFGNFPVILVIFLSVFLGSCAFYDLKQDLTEYNNSFALTGKVIETESNSAPIVVMLYKKNKRELTISQYLVTDNTKHYSFIVGKGEYYISGFEDLNSNLAYDEGESLGFYGKPTEIIVAANDINTTGSKSFQKLNIKISKNNIYPDEMPKVLSKASFAAKSFAKMAVITTLDDKIFNPVNGSLGLWKPFSFLIKIGVGVYFLEPYNPNKIPVLFVHGAGGTPASWKPIIKKLDKQKYQPWFYYYPSGFRLETIARVLNTIIEQLHDKYNFNQLRVVAHSMGGLVSRAFILKNIIEDQHNYIDTFISISTPWGGISSAKMGVENVSTPIPNWHDVSPNSEFLKYIYSEKMPTDVDFYLIFGVRGKYSMIVGNNDGAVEIASEIFSAAQSDAKGFYGFNEDHTSILTSDEVIVLLLELINEKRN